MAQAGHGTTARQSTAPSLPQGRAATVMLVLMFASNLLASFNQSLMNIALDRVASTFHVSLSQANWTVLGFTVVAATTITMAASLLKRYGVRKVMFAGYGLSLAGSLLGLFSWDFAALLAARLVQALTVGLFFPVVTSVVLVLAPADKKATLLSVNAGVIGVGLALSPLVSGRLLDCWGVHGLFVVPAVTSVLLIAAGIPLLHDVYERQAKAIDAPSVALSFIGLGLFIYGLNEVTRDTVPSLLLICAGIAVVALFARRQSSIADPLLDLSPMVHPRFVVGEVLMMLGFMGSIFLSLLLPLYLEGVAGTSAFRAGLLLVAPILTYSVTCFVSGHIEDKHGVWPLVPCGFLVLFVGYVAMGLTSSTMTVGLMMASAAVSYAGVGLVFPTLKAADLAILPRDIYAFGSSIHSVLVQVATSTGSALFVGVMSADVDRLRAAGAAKADAYAAGFSHALVIDLVIIGCALVASVFFARKARKG